MKQIGLALHNYHDTHMVFPPGGVSRFATSSSTFCGPAYADGGGRSQAPWTVMILPFLDEGPRYDSFNLNAELISIADGANFGNANAANRAEWFRNNTRYQCPSDPNANQENRTNNYFGVQGGIAQGESPHCAVNSARVWTNNGILYHNSSMRMRDVVDGTSNTFLVGETNYQSTYTSNTSGNQFYTWASSDWPLALHGSPAQVAAAVLPINSLDPPAPAANTFNSQTRLFGSYHTGGCHFLMADGSVQFLSENINMGLYHGLAKRADGLPVGGLGM